MYNTLLLLYCTVLNCCCILQYSIDAVLLYITILLLYYTILYCCCIIVQYYIAAMLYNTILLLYYTILYSCCIVQYYIAAVLYNTLLLYCTVLYCCCIVQYYIDAVLYSNILLLCSVNNRAILFEKLWTAIREGPASQPQSTLSCCKNLPPLLKNSDPPKLGPKKIVSIIAFRISFTLDVKIVWFCCQVAVCVQKRHKNAIFECGCFQKFNFDCLLLKLLIYSQTTKNIFKFVCPLLTQLSIIISGTWVFSTLYLASSHKSWR